MTVKQPELSFDFPLTPGSTKKAMGNLGEHAKKRDLWMVAPGDLRPIPNFNVRIKDDAYRQHIRSLAESMKEEGYYPDKPLAGYVCEEADGPVIYFYDGHCRHEAVLLAVTEGASIPYVPIVVAHGGTSLEDLTVALVRSNSGKPLTPLETSVVCKRLSRGGWESQQVAKRLGFTEQYVNDLLLLAAAPSEIRNMVAEGRVAATVAVDTIKQHGVHALSVLEKAELHAISSGKTKVTNQHLPGKPLQKVIRKNAETMATAITAVKNDPGYNSLSESVREQLETLHGLLEEARVKEGELLLDSHAGIG